MKGCWHLSPVCLDPVLKGLKGRVELAEGVVDGEAHPLAKANLQPGEGITQLP